MMSSQTTAEARPAPPTKMTRLSPALLVRIAVTALVVVNYYAWRERLVPGLESLYSSLTGWTTSAHMGVWLVTAILLGLAWLWRKELSKDKRWHAPLLVTSILVMADAGFGILLSHHSALLSNLTGGVVTKYSPTFLAILTAVVAESLLGRFFYGKWPHLASAFVSGISAGILVKSPYLWPFVMCAMLSITSKYVLRIGERHLWNPTNFGMTAMLFLAPAHMASLSIEAGNEWASAVVIWILGGMILYQLGRLHIPVAFALAFVPLSFLRSQLTGDPWQAELAPITSPMFQLYIFFMITDPKTTTKARWSQILVAVLVAVAETFYRVVFRDVHSLYHALFTVGPIANLIEIGYARYWGRAKKPGDHLAIAPRGAPSYAMKS